MDTLQVDPDLNPDLNPDQLQALARVLTSSRLIALRRTLYDMADYRWACDLVTAGGGTTFMGATPTTTLLKAAQWLQERAAAQTQQALEEYTL